MIEVNNRIINPKDLMDRVRRNVLNKKEIYVSDELFTAENIDLDGINKEIDSLFMNIQKLNETWQINDFDIKSHRKILGPFLVLAKRFVRKMVYWLIRPYIDQQVKFNAAATRAISDIARIQSQLINSLDSKEK